MLSRLCIISITLFWSVYKRSSYSVVDRARHYFMYDLSRMDNLYIVCHVLDTFCEYSLGLN